jgi:hypothetical protein
MDEFVHSNTEREMEVYGYDSVVKSHCRMCHGGCLRQRRQNRKDLWRSGLSYKPRNPVLKGHWGQSTGLSPRSFDLPCEKGRIERERKMGTHILG